MSYLIEQKNSRRNFLKFLAASPLFSTSLVLSHNINEEGNFILNVKDALDVFDFKAAAKKILPPAHYG